MHGIGPVDETGQRQAETVDNQIDTTTGTVKLRAEFQNANGALFPNQFVNTRLLVNTLENQILIPSSAIQHNGDTAFVYLIKPGPEIRKAAQGSSTEQDRQWRPNQGGGSRAARERNGNKRRRWQRTAIPRRNADGEDGSHRQRMDCGDGNCTGTVVANSSFDKLRTSPTSPFQSGIPDTQTTISGEQRSVSPSRPFILRPVATSLLMVAILLVGIVAYTQLPISALPEVDYPTIQVLTFYPGASPDVTATTITAPLERQFGEMQGLSQMTSTSAGGVSVIVLQFNLSLSIDVAEEEVQ